MCSAPFLAHGIHGLYKTIERVYSCVAHYRFYDYVTGLQQNGTTTGTFFLS